MWTDLPFYLLAENLVQELGCISFSSKGANRAEVFSTHSALYVHTCVCMHVYPLSSDAYSSFQFICQPAVSIILNNKQKDSVELNWGLILGLILVILTYSPGKFSTEHQKCYMYYQTLKYITVNKVFMIIYAEKKLILSPDRKPLKSNINNLSLNRSHLKKQQLQMCFGKIF